MTDTIFADAMTSVVVLTIWCCCGAPRDGTPGNDAPTPPQTTSAQLQELQQLRRRIDELEKSLTQPEKSSASPPKSPNISSPGTSPAPGIDDAKKSGVKEPGSSQNADLNAFKCLWKDGFFAKTEDGRFQFHIGGRIHTDTAWFVAPQSVENGLSNPLQDGVTIRRLRIESDGVVYSNIFYSLGADFSRASDLRNRTDDPTANVFITNAWVATNDYPALGLLKVGHQKEILSLAGRSSSNFSPFMERAEVFDAFLDVFQYSTGISMQKSWSNDQFISWFGVFKPGSLLGGFAVGDGKYAYDALFSWIPVNDERDQKWFLASLSGSYRDVAAQESIINARPLIRAGSRYQVPLLVQTSEVQSNQGIQYAVLGLSGSKGPWTVAGEYMFRYQGNASVTATVPHSSTKIQIPLGDLALHGAYGEVLCFLTPGDHRPLATSQMGYARVRPVRNFLRCADDPAGKERGPGAWEVGFRADWVDTHNAVPTSGSLTSLTAGLNWYLNPNARVMFNYIYTYIDKSAPMYSGAVNGFGMRAIIDF